MAKVTLHKSSDGKLHDTATLCAKHEVSLRVSFAAKDATFNLSAACRVDDEQNDAVYASDLPQFIVDNADQLRNLLNGALIAKRVRKAAKAKSESSAAVA